MSGSGTCMFALNASLRTREPTGDGAGPPPPPVEPVVVELDPPHAESAIAPTARAAIRRRERKRITRSPVAVDAVECSMEDRTAVVADDLAGDVSGRRAHE